MLRPKRSLQHGHQLASREFTDREEPRKAFYHSFSHIREEGYHVLTYYGVGGIGKTRLQKELDRYVKETDSKAMTVAIDFREEQHRFPADALVWMRQAVTQNRPVKFTTFDFAYAVYWAKMNPHVEMKAERRRLPFLEESNYIGDLIAQLENVPVAQWIPKTIKLIDTVAQYSDMMKWWRGRGREVLQSLRNMHPADIEEMLIVYWAADFMDYLKEKNEKAVFFLDTYEALWEKERNQGSFFARDEWIREFILQFHEVRALFVICGREKVRWAEVNEEWNEYLEQHLIGELSPADCHQFLDSCGIHDADIQRCITAGSEGLPYYLDLMVDTYQVIQQKREPDAEDFSLHPQEVLERFLRYLDLSEKETLKVLSVPRFWDQELFQALVEEFRTYYPVTAYQDLCRFSFISRQNNTDNWEMHKLMRAGLQKEVNDKEYQLCEKIHRFVWAYYTKRLPCPSTEDIEEPHIMAFTEAVFHARSIFSDDELLNWLTTAVRPFRSKGSWGVLIRLFEELLEEKSASDSLCVFLYRHLVELYLFQGNHEKAKAYGMLAVELYEGIDSLTEELAAIHRCLAELYADIADYDLAVQHFKISMKAYEELASAGKQSCLNEQGMIYTRLGKIYLMRSEYTLAKDCYERAISVCEACLLHGYSSSAHAVLGQAYEKMGELYEIEGQATKQKESYLQSIQAYEHALQVKEANYIPTLAYKGLAYKRLAEYHASHTDYEQAVHFYEKAVQTYQHVLTVSPYYIDAYEMLGHASIDLMDTHVRAGAYEEAVKSFDMGVEAFRSALELSEKQGSSRNRISSAYRTLGDLHEAKGEYPLAVQAYHQAVHWNDDLLKHSPEYIYAYSTRGKAFKRMGDCYVKMHDASKAVKSYRTAQECFKKMQEKAPDLKAAAEALDEIERCLELL
jgi:tetratricopeptide (TPR) repeat protein